MVKHQKVFEFLSDGIVKKQSVFETDTYYINKYNLIPILNIFILYYSTLAYYAMCYACLQ